MIAAALRDRLGLTDDELMTVLDTDPLTLITDELDHRPEIKILLELTAEIDTTVLHRWVRANGRHGRPLDLLLRHDFAAFEDAVADLRDRGLVLRGGGGAGR